MKSFSLSSVLLLVTLVALLLANVLSWRKSVAIHSELERVQNEFGVIDASDSSKTSVKRFVNKDYRIASESGWVSAESFRVVPADGVAYALHLSEMNYSGRGAYPSVEELKPNASVQFESWRPGAVVSCVVTSHDKKPRVLVTADSELVIDHQSPEPWGTVKATTETWMGLGSGQSEYDPGEVIRLYWWYAEGDGRGFMLWLEPLD